MLHLKRVDTIIRAVHQVDCVKLDIYGTGPMESKWRRLAKRLLGAELAAGKVVFHGHVSISAVRQLMRDHDVYVLASDGREGWGAVVSEALEERAYVIGTFEAGASATILPKKNLYHAGDADALAKILQRILAERENGTVQVSSIGDWTAAKAAEALCNEMG